MKVIDLFQGIARDEEVPKHIIVNNSRYYFDCNDSDYYSDNDEEPSLLERVWRHNAYVWLNLEVEIIEEEKEIEEITLLGKEIGYGVMSAWLDFTPNDNEQKICRAIESIGLKINELVREVRKLKKEGK